MDSANSPTLLSFLSSANSCLDLAALARGIESGLGGVKPRVIQLAERADSQTLAELGFSAERFEQDLAAGRELPVILVCEVGEQLDPAMELAGQIATIGYRVVAVFAKDPGISRRDQAGLGIVGLIQAGEKGWPADPIELGERLARTWLKQ